MAGNNIIYRSCGFQAWGMSPQKVDRVCDLAEYLYISESECVSDGKGAHKRNKCQIVSYGKSFQVMELKIQARRVASMGASRPRKASAALPTN